MRENSGGDRKPLRFGARVSERAGFVRDKRLNSASEVAGAPVKSGHDEIEPEDERNFPDHDYLIQ